MVQLRIAYSSMRIVRFIPIDIKRFRFATSLFSRFSTVVFLKILHVKVTITPINATELDTREYASLKLYNRLLCYLGFLRVIEPVISSPLTVKGVDMTKYLWYSFKTLYTKIFSSIQSTFPLALFYFIFSLR